MATTKRVCFRFDAPDAGEVFVVGSFDGWSKARKLEKGEAGVWRVCVDMEPGRYEYRFSVDGVWRNDPANAERIPNVFGSVNDVLRVV